MEVTTVEGLACDDCFEPVSEGDDYYALPGMNVCQDCIDSYLQAAPPPNEVTYKVQQVLPIPGAVA